MIERVQQLRRNAEAHGVRLITLGDRTLRADAVPVAAISVLQFIWENAY